MAYWLFKTEPDTFSIDTLRTQKVSCWEGVRNYQARNMMRDQVSDKRKGLRMCSPLLLFGVLQLTASDLVGSVQPHLLHCCQSLRYLAMLSSLSRVMYP